MNRYNAQILNDKGEYHLQFETDCRDNFNAMEKLAQKIIDKNPRTNFDKITENKWTLAKFIIDTVTHCQFNNCEDCPLYEVDGCSRQEKVKEWLQQEIEDEL